MLERADVRDRLIGADSIAALRENAVVGTSSPRRAAQLGRLRPDIRTMLFRGNVDTRLGKLAVGEVDATLLAAAGLDRLGRHDTGVAIAFDQMLPAPAQGAVGIETLADGPARELVAAIDHADTHRAVAVERGLLAALAADCHSPVAALARVEGDGVFLRAQLLTERGDESIEGELRGDDAVGAALARDLLARAPAAVRRLFAG